MKTVFGVECLLPKDYVKRKNNLDCDGLVCSWSLLAGIEEREADGHAGTIG